MDIVPPGAGEPGLDGSDGSPALQVSGSLPRLMAGLMPISVASEFAAYRRES